jgi:fructokinase
VTRYRIVGIGEVLWDIFPDGPRFGGAPSNFACSTAELALDVADVFVVSAVGNDELGQRAIDSLTRHHVSVEGVQRNSKETGRVLVELDSAGIASYRFAENSAWDQLVWTGTLQKLAAECDAVCFGTLGQRDNCSARTIRQFVRTTPKHALRILDVNLREPHVNDRVIRESLELANVLKLNEHELPRLARLQDVSGTDLEIMQRLASKYNLQTVALTRGQHGALIISGNQVSDLPAVPVVVANTVGAGDAYSAAMTLGLLTGNAVDAINRSAILAAAHVCSTPGATTQFPESIRGSVLTPTPPLLPP